MRILTLAVFAALIFGLTACEEPGPPPAGGHYDLRPPGVSLPSGATCAEQVRSRGNTWEPRPANREANHTTPPASYVVNGYGGMSHKSETWGRVHGDFTGTTNQIIEWASCKWGLNDDWTRAQFVVETNWVQSFGGDWGDCGEDAPSSLGISQTKWCQHPGTRPWSRPSTAFAADYFGAVLRGCYNGWDYVTSQPGNWLGCVDRWFSGGLNPNSQYVGWVKDELAAKRWRDWEG